jgi:tRNA 2-thiouridine synthesizing protein A
MASGMDEDLEPEEQIKLEELLRTIGQLREFPCHACGAPICGHEALMSFAMGFKNEPKCWSCLSVTMGHSKEVLRDHVFAYIKHRSCHYEGWQWASREEGFAPENSPKCLWPDSSTSSDNPDLIYTTISEQKIPITDMGYDAEWNAGSLGCGDLVLELRIRLEELQPGQILKLIATDSGAPEDLPAWCRMTKHALLHYNHPVYLIKRK